ncbi:MAG TPA: DUF1016 N-terminal domain-containing protein, partial [Opitutaceae bacterium]|nr:DUF1016 N-terminal domain-containing protein [Opitutaceae bacterium]
EALVAGLQRVEGAKLRTYWETGRLIHEHLLQFRDRADYGGTVILRLEADVNISERVLYRCLNFHRSYPIPAALPELTWMHYCSLMRVDDLQERKALTQEAVKREWTYRQLEERVIGLLAAAQPTASGEGDANGSAPTGRRPKLLTPKCGTPGLHLVVDRGAAGLAVDLGFKLYRALAPEQQKRLEKGVIVRLSEDRITRIEDATTADLFTYAATIRRVVDADTLVIGIEVAPGIWLEEKLRLRGLDAPELSTAEGKAAKRFVDGLLPVDTAVVISTTKPDKYDRYLADVFVGLAGGEGRVAGAETEIFLNNVLLEQGYAERKDAWEFGDWGLV